MKENLFITIITIMKVEGLLITIFPYFTLFLFLRQSEYKI